MANIKINEAFKDRVVSHSRTSKAVGSHTPAELKQLALIARKSENPILLECFSELPTLEDLLSDKVTSEIAALKPSTPTPPAAPVTTDTETKK